LVLDRNSSETGHFVADPPFQTRVESAVTGSGRLRETRAIRSRIGMPARAVREMQSGAVTKAAVGTFWRAGLGRRAPPPVGRWQPFE
jgi:hypothetical protein